MFISYVHLPYARHTQGTELWRGPQPLHIRWHIIMDSRVHEDIKINLKGYCQQNPSSVLSWGVPTIPGRWKKILHQGGRHPWTRLFKEEHRKGDMEPVVPSTQGKQHNNRGVGACEGRSVLGMGLWGVIECRCKIVASGRHPRVPKTWVLHYNKSERANSFWRHPHEE